MPNFNRSKKYCKKLSKYKKRQMSRMEVESIAEDVAEREIRSSRNVHLKRNYLWHHYDPADNVFTELDVQGGWQDEHYSHINFEGRCVELSNIGKQDIEMVNNQPQNDDPETGENENLDQDGLAQGMTTRLAISRRTKAIIKIQSVSCLIRARMQLTADDTYGWVKIKYAFVLWKKEGMNLVNPNGDFPKPDPINLLTILPFGYSHKLDSVEEEKLNTENTRILKQGEMTLQVDQNQTSEKYGRLYRVFPNGLEIRYDPKSQNGQRTEGDSWKLYFVARSNVSSQEAFLPIMPRLHVVTKVSFYE